jgi:hypothetical protein
MEMGCTAFCITARTKAASPNESIPRGGLTSLRTFKGRSSVPSLLIAERLALERLKRLRGYPNKSVIDAAEMLWRRRLRPFATIAPRTLNSPFLDLVH